MLTDTGVWVSTDKVTERGEHLADDTEHFLSVSDIVVLNENGNVKSYFVDSISIRELLDFLDLEPELNQEEVAYRIGINTLLFR